MSSLKQAKTEIESNTFIQSPISGCLKQSQKVNHCNGKHLVKNIGETVSIVATTVRLNDTFGTFIASDGFVFNVKYKKDHFSESNNKFFDKKYNQIYGCVEDDCTITYLSHISIGDNFCMWSWNKFLELRENYPQLF